MSRNATAGAAGKRRSSPKLAVKKGDTVIILNGKDAGKSGEVVAAHPTTGKVTVAGLNLVTVHQKPRRDSPLGQMQQGMLDKPAPLFGSKVMLRCPHCGRGTRPQHVMGGDGRRVRTCRKCDKQID